VISVLLVDHPATVLHALRESLLDQDDIIVKGEASDSARAVRLATSLKPDAVVLDAEMPDLDLAAVVRDLRTLAPASAIVILALEPRRVEGTIPRTDHLEVVSKLQGAAALIARIRHAAGR